MNKRVTLKEVALAAGVSTATVSRVLTYPSVVSAATREQVMAAVRKLDYQPDAVARSLASGQSRTVGCVVPTLDHAIFARSTQAMQTTLAPIAKPAHAATSPDSTNRGDCGQKPSR